MGAAATSPQLGFDDVPAAVREPVRRTGPDDREIWDLIALDRASVLPRTGVRALMLAVLEDAIRCYFQGEPRVRAEAELWIEVGPRHWAFSFDVICESFGLDPAATRMALRRMRQADPRPTMLRKRHRGTGRRPGISAHH